jgi:hypothetical protein
LSIPSHGSFPRGGTLRGLLMKRQSSQVSNPNTSITSHEEESSDISLLSNSTHNLHVVTHTPSNGSTDGGESPLTANTPLSPTPSSGIKQPTYGSPTEDVLGNQGFRLS